MQITRKKIGEWRATSKLALHFRKNCVFFVCWVICMLFECFLKFIFSLLNVLGYLHAVDSFSKDVMNKFTLVTIQ